MPTPGELKGTQTLVKWLSLVALLGAGSTLLLDSVDAPTFRTVLRDAALVLMAGAFCAQHWRKRSGPDGATGGIS